MITEETAPRKRRATPRDVSTKWAALAVVRALHPEIARVQQRAAVLCSLSQSSLRASHDLATLRAEVDALQAAARACSATLAEKLETLPAEVRNHSSIVDTARAIDSLCLVLERARHGLIADAGTPQPAAGPPSQSRARAPIAAQR